jgi:hypothetical protein
MHVSRVYNVTAVLFLQFVLQIIIIIIIIIIILIIIIIIIIIGSKDIAVGIATLQAGWYEFELR